jgi:Animal haem peroxidase
MASRKRARSSRHARVQKGEPANHAAARAVIDELPEHVREQLFQPLLKRTKGSSRVAARASRERLALDVAAGDTVPKDVLEAADRLSLKAAVPIERLPQDIPPTNQALKHQAHRFHGAKINLAWFPWKLLASQCADKFGYLTPASVRNATKLPFNGTTIGLMDNLGELMGDPGRETSPDATIPAGFTYVGQFVDHDITFDVSSRLDAPTDATTVNNMRTPALDLDAVYGDGPALDPFLYLFPTSGPATAIKFQFGSNRNFGPGGSAGSVGTPAGMVTRTDFDVPRIHNPLNPAASTNTAVIGDPRNDENLIVSQLHHAVQRMHNRVIDSLVLSGFAGDIFVEARKIVTHHYQFAVVHDFLGRVCGAGAVGSALASVTAPIGSPFRMPVEFAVAAYRFGHSMIRDRYWVNFNFTNATLGQVFQFIRNPQLPVFSNWVVDFNAFFDTGFVVPVNNKARKIDSVLANGLEALPGFSGMMAILAQRNLRRGLALGLPSGQGVAGFFGVVPLTPAQLQQGLPSDEINILNLNNKLLLKRTPLWYYILREAAVLNSGDQLGPVGARIVAETFVRILKRDATSFLNVSGGFTPSLPSATAGTFTFADLVNFAGVTQP